ncbi:MAG TPA: DUF6259 domain-containing protein [Gaiellaceae bacterium]|jgi:hypothetical protein
MVLTTNAYRLTLGKRNGKVLSLVDGTGGELLAKNLNRCLWGAAANSDKTYIGGCSFAPRFSRRFAYRWNPATATLTLSYTGSTLGSAVVTVRARPTFFDLRLRIDNTGHVLSRVEFPEALAADVATVAAGYAPTVLPGVQLAPAFFSRVGNDVQLYPSRWAFADYLALDVGASHVSIYSISRGPLYPVELGFLHGAVPAPCSGSSFCLVHEFETWIKRGATWTSPVIRIRVGDTTEQSILAYRHDNGIDAYPSLETKLGARLTMYAEAPMFKANLRLLKPFRDWAAELQQLPSPLLLHPAGYQVGGFDVNDPDFLPPDPSFGTSADFASMIAAAHKLGDLVMPYGNLSWWDPTSPTMESLPAGVQTKNVAVLDAAGNPATISYGDHTGVIVSPYSAFVRRRIAQFMNDWQTQVPADCIFLDQLGARPWLRDFNPAAPTVTSYDDGWLAVLATYSNRCIMVEDGWDRLARNAVGFNGSLLMMSRELDLPNTYFGAGNWQPYPLAAWLLHDKVLMYQHDLYDGTMANDLEVLTWNMAFGLISSYSWDELGPSENPWLDLVARLQHDFGPHYVGVPLSDYRNLATEVNESTYGDLSVVASRDMTSGYSVDGYDVAPGGFFARTATNDLLAGAFAGSFGGLPLSGGVHYVIEERDQSSLTVRQPVGADSDLAVEPPASWSPGRSLTATAVAADGAELGTVSGRLQDGHFVFHYAAVLNGQPVAAYRIVSS